MGVWIETNKAKFVRDLTKVTPCVGVWIETRNEAANVRWEAVTPCVGVWIETTTKKHYDGTTESHPAWVCGLKQ